MMVIESLLGQAWASHTLIMTTDLSPHWIMVCIYVHCVSTCMYLSMYYLPHVCRTLVPKIRLHPEMLHVFRYIDVLMCVIALNLTSSKVKCDHCLPWRLAMKTGMGMWIDVQTHSINGFSLLRQWSCSYQTTCQCASLWIRNARVGIDRWADCTAALWRTLISTWVRHWTTCMLFVDVEPYRLIMQRHHWHCWLCSYMYYHNNNQLGHIPSVPWMH